MISNPATHSNNYTSYPSYSNNTNNSYANMRENNENSNDSNSNPKQDPTTTTTTTTTNSKSLNKQTSQSTISHATRIEPTNLSYKDLLRKHQFTPQSADSTPQTSPMKQEFDLSLNNNNNNNNNKSKSKTTKQLEIEQFRRKPIIEEPKKPVSGYQLFAKWKRRFKPDEIDASYPQSKALSIEWNSLSQNDRDKWNKKAEIEKIQYKQSKNKWLLYVKEAKLLGIPVPTKSVKPMIQQIKIKNLLNLIPNINKANKETIFIISKATEMFIQYYSSKAIEIQSKIDTSANANTNTNDESFITPLHAFDALQTSHKFNFLRAVTVKPINHKKNIKKRKRNNKKTQENSNNNNNNDPPKKKRKLETGDLTNQIITNHESNNATVQSPLQTVVQPQIQPQVQPQPQLGAYPTYAGYPYIAANGSYSHGYYPAPHNGMINTMNPTMTATPFSAIYQPPNPFTHAGYSPKYAINNNINNTQTQIVNVQQIFGSDE